FVSKPVAPNKRLIMMLGLLTAVGGAFGLAFLAEGFDQTLRTTDQVESQLGVPVLLSLPYRKRRRQSGKSAQPQTSSGANGHAKLQLKQGQREDYRALLRELMVRGANGGSAATHAKTIGVVACESSKLRSQVASDLAIRAAYDGAENVLLIDAD